MSKIWLITGAGRGMGVDIAKAALAAGHKVVATGRNTDKVAQALGKSADMFVVKLDITKPTDAEYAVKASVDKFGRIDVLVNNAANFCAGFFEELLPEQMERQLSTSEQAHRRPRHRAVKETRHVVLRDGLRSPASHLRSLSASSTPFNGTAFTWGAR
jgi:NAD(P)-dependent dehydrogenase (short-subunit alcohol dehydrogenase family)